ncbi:hypothetical protein LOAG_03300 [Loa loa]|uniref:Uncharacterized protein n=1 Tax=Loa loa TaxID=7209 RepID=A0A1S0U6P3_LOALO|nr:hypothetical protein LOAG_03300 [Loa loa]EFO25186.2 hypothetical protein LOAG_03300 [Loa loa]
MEFLQEIVILHRSKEEETKEFKRIQGIKKKQKDQLLRESKEPGEVRRNPE